MKFLFFIILSFYSVQSFADAWREGKVKELASGYDGVSITFRMYDLTSNSPAINYSDCTCNSSWKTLCLNPSRANFDKEYAILLAANTANRNVKVIFNDSTCFVKAIVIPHQ